MKYFNRWPMRTITFLCAGHLTSHPKTGSQTTGLVFCIVTHPTISNIIIVLIITISIVAVVKIKSHDVECPRN